MSSRSAPGPYARSIQEPRGLRTRLCRISALPLRLIIGYGFMAHGFAKLSRGPESFAALFTIHLPYGFFSVKLAQVSESGTRFGPVGYEIILLYLAGLITLVLGNAGSLSIDEWRARKSGRAAFRNGARVAS